MSKHPNDWYIEAIREEDEAKIKEIFDEFLPMVESFICSNSGTVQDANDIFTDAVIVIWTKICGDNLILTSSFSTYLFSICRNQWLNVLRHKKIENRVINENQALLIPDEDVDRLMEEEEKHRILQENIAKLPDNCQKLLTLSLHDRKKMKEIAMIMKWSDNYAGKRKTQCIKKLFSLIKSDKRYKMLSSRFLPDK